jgi:hypothetical protein
MSGAIRPLPQYAFMAWGLVKYRDNFTFSFTFTSGTLVVLDPSRVRIQLGACLSVSFSAMSS